MNNKLYVSILIVLLIVSLAMALTDKSESSQPENFSSCYTEESLNQLT